MSRDLPESLRSPLLGLKAHKASFAMNALPRFGEKSVELLPWGQCGLRGPWLGPDLTGPVFKAPAVSESAGESMSSADSLLCALGAA